MNQIFTREGWILVCIMTAACAFMYFQGRSLRRETRNLTAKYNRNAKRK